MSARFNRFVGMCVLTLSVMYRRNTTTIRSSSAGRTCRPRCRARIRRIRVRCAVIAALREAKMKIFMAYARPLRRLLSVVHLWRRGDFAHLHGDIMGALKGRYDSYLWTWEVDHWVARGVYAEMDGHWIPPDSVCIVQTVCICAGNAVRDTNSSIEQGFSSDRLGVCTHLDCRAKAFDIMSAFTNLMIVVCIWCITGKLDGTRADYPRHEMNLTYDEGRMFAHESREVWCETSV